MKKYQKYLIAYVRTTVTASPTFELKQEIKSTIVDDTEFEFSENGIRRWCDIKNIYEDDTTIQHHVLSVTPLPE